MAPREVTLVLCTPEGVVGALAPFRVDFPYWQDSGHLLDRCREEHGVTPVILRLLSAAGRANGDGGPTTYLAQLTDDDQSELTLFPWSGPDPLAPHPLRARYATPGGPQADLAWAGARLADAGIEAQSAHQERTWNLSCIWRLDTSAGEHWLKCAPGFFASEGPLIEWLAGLSPAIAQTVPHLVARDDGRLLMRGIEGPDRYDSDLEAVCMAIDHLVALQVAAVGRLDDLTTLGVLDQRIDALTPRLTDVVARHRHELTSEEAGAVEVAVASVPDRFARAASALPETLTHGDFHSGNLRGHVRGPGSLRILDWGDASISHPAFDLMRMRGIMPQEHHRAIEDRWVRAWRSAYPDCDPMAAVEALEPVGGLMGAAGYQRFLDHIEPDERIYHQTDPLACLRAVGSAA